LNPAGYLIFVVRKEAGVGPFKKMIFMSTYDTGDRTRVSIVEPSRGILIP